MRALPDKELTWWIQKVIWVSVGVQDQDQPRAATNTCTRVSSPLQLLLMPCPNGGSKTQQQTQNVPLLASCSWQRDSHLRSTLAGRTRLFSCTSANTATARGRSPAPIAMVTRSSRRTDMPSAYRTKQELAGRAGEDEHLGATMTTSVVMEQTPKIMGSSPLCAATLSLCVDICPH